MSVSSVFMYVRDKHTCVQGSQKGAFAPLVLEL